MLDISIIIAKAQANAIAKGFIKPGQKRTIAEHAALLHTEVSEMFEAWRQGLPLTRNMYEFPRSEGADRIRRTRLGGLDEEDGAPIGIPSELADVVIRACQMAGEYEIDLEAAIVEKMEYNATRPIRHGNKRI